MIEWKEKDKWTVTVVTGEDGKDKPARVEW